MNILCIDIGGSHLMAGVAQVNLTSASVNSDNSDNTGDPIPEPGAASVSDGPRLELTWNQTSSNPELPPHASKDQILETIYSVVRELDISSCERIGITIPGLTDPQTGVWVYAPFSGIHNFPIAQTVSEKFGSLPVNIENDVNACALAERYFGVCRDCPDFLWITVSNGIGGGLVLNGDIYSGNLGNAGEIGHFCVNESSQYQCGCGHFGCLEIEASGRAIAAKYQDRRAHEPNQASPAPASAKQIAQWAREGQPLAREVFDEAGRYIGRAASYAVNLLNIQRVVLGGGVSGAFDILFPVMSATFCRMVFQAANPQARIEQTGLGYQAALAGAAAIAWRGTATRTDGTATRTE